MDPLTGVKVDRGGRPRRSSRRWIPAEPAPPVDAEADPFAEGHEARTPPEVYAVRPGGGAPDTPGWTVRVVPNLYPALSPDPEPTPAEANPDLFAARPALGAHEVIVNGPQPVGTLAELPSEQVARGATSGAIGCAPTRTRPSST